MDFKDIVNKWCGTNLILRILVVGRRHWNMNGNIKCFKVYNNGCKS